MSGITIGGGKGGTASPNVPAPAADTLSPTEITNYRVDAGVSELVHSWDQSADRYDVVNAHAAEGVATYRIVNEADTLIQAVTAPAANIQGQSTFVNIGAGTSSVTDIDGNQFKITAQGAGIDVSQHQIGFRYDSKTGDWLHVTYIADQAGSDQGYAQAGPMARISTAPGAISLCAVIFQSAEDRRLQAKVRLLVDAAYGDPGSGGLIGSVDGINGPVWVGIVKTSNHYEWWYSFTNLPNSWQKFAELDFSGGSTWLVGDFYTSQGGSQGYAVFRGSKTVFPSRVTYTQTTSSTVTSKIRAEDANTPARVTAYTATITSVPLTEEPPEETNKTWDPNHIVASNSFPYLGDVGSRNTIYDVWNRIPLKPYWVAGLLFVPWGSVNVGTLGTGPYGFGTYDFSELRLHRDRIKLKGGKFGFELIVSKFDVPVGSPNDLRIHPQWMQDIGAVTFEDPLGTGHGLIYPDFGDMRVVNGHIALIQAFVEEFGDDPDFVLFRLSETANMDLTYLDVTLDACGAAFLPIHAHLTLQFNYGNSPFSPKEILEMMFANKIGWADTDMIALTAFGWESHGARAVQGRGIDYLYEPGDGGGLDCGTHNYLPSGQANEIVISQAFEELGGKPPADLIDYAMFQMRNNFPVWSHGGALTDLIAPAIDAISPKIDPMAQLLPSCYEP